MYRETHTIHAYLVSRQREEKWKAVSQLLHHVTNYNRVIKIKAQLIAIISIAMTHYNVKGKKLLTFSL